MNNPSLADNAARLTGLALTNYTASGRQVNRLRGPTHIDATTSQITIEVSGKQFLVTFTQMFAEEN